MPLPTTVVSEPLLNPGLEEGAQTAPAVSSVRVAHSLPHTKAAASSMKVDVAVIPTCSQHNFAKFEIRGCVARHAHCQPDGAPRRSPHIERSTVSETAILIEKLHETAQRVARHSARDSLGSSTCIASPNTGGGSPTARLDATPPTSRRLATPLLISSARALLPA